MALLTVGLQYVLMAYRLMYLHGPVRVEFWGKQGFEIGLMVMCRPYAAARDAVFTRCYITKRGWIRRIDDNN